MKHNSKILLSEKDKEFLRACGIDLDSVEYQLWSLENGFPYVTVLKAATIGDGIKKIYGSMEEYYVRQYNNLIKGKRVIKFVPASGAASRMFKELIYFLENYDKVGEKNVDEKRFESGLTFLKNLPKFAFFSDLDKYLTRRNNFVNNYRTVLTYLLYDKGLNYVNKPKGLIPFHKYGNSYRTAFMEQLADGVYYLRDKDNNVFVHFTLSSEYLEMSKQHIDKGISILEEMYNAKYDISYSEQMPRTNTVSLYVDGGDIVRDRSGNIYLRAGGHGALLDNLNNIDADLIFIKNIDNVSHDRFALNNSYYKKILASYLLKIQSKIHKFLHAVDSGSLTESMINKIKSILVKDFMIKDVDRFFSMGQYNGEEVIKNMYNYLNRPIRVCGMVENKGEPGGGPFWVFDKKYSMSLQIIEKSQINIKNQFQKEKLQEATHFNPVDIVCSIKDHNGKKYNLKNYVDKNTGFISIKSYNGKDIRVMELPGLWNGCMWDWLTIFIEVPLSTFSPVKEVTDLLRREHLEFD